MDVNAQAQPKECPICHDPFNIALNVPKIFGVCGHSVCEVCVPVCVQKNSATCPLCRQETPVPANGLPINFGMRDMIESVPAADIKCSGCSKKVPSSEVFACKTCTGDKVVSFCALCAMNAHRAHDVVKYDELATPKEISETHRVVRYYNSHCRTHAAGIKSELELAQTTATSFLYDCQLGADDPQAGEAIFLTKEENRRLYTGSIERGRNLYRVLESTRAFVRKFNEDLNKIRIDEPLLSSRGQRDAASLTTGSLRQPGPSNSTRGPTRRNQGMDDSPTQAKVAKKNASSR